MECTRFVIVGLCSVSNYSLKDVLIVFFFFEKRYGMVHSLQKICTYVFVICSGAYFIVALNFTVVKIFLGDKRWKLIFMRKSRSGRSIKNNIPLKEITGRKHLSYP